MAKHGQGKASNGEPRGIRGDTAYSQAMRASSPSNPSDTRNRRSGAPGEVVSLNVTRRDDASFVADVVAKQPAAIAELFDRYEDLVRRTLVRALGNARDLDDMTQDTFLTVIRRCSTLRDPSALRSFVVSVSIRIARNELRKRSLRRFVGLDEGVTSPVVGPHDAEVAEGVRRVYAAIERLGTDGRLAFVLRHVEGYDLVETAAACECSLATIKRRLVRAEARFEAIAKSDPALREFLTPEEES